MVRSAPPERPTCRLRASNGNPDVVVFGVERALEAAGDPDRAETFRREVDAYRRRPDATYRGVLAIVSRYVDLI